MTVWLLATHTGSGERQWFPVGKMSFMVGRPSSGDEPGKMVIDFDSTLSRRHFAARWDGQSLHIRREPQSTHALLFRGKESDEFSLQIGDYFKAGSTRFEIFQKKDLPEKQTDTDLPEDMFVPIRNPFIAGNPIADPTLFFGRHDVFEFVQKMITQANSGMAMVLFGGRRTGKTSVLWQITSGRLGDEFIPVYNDLQEMADIDTFNFFERLQGNIIRVLGSRGMAVDGQDFSRRDKNPYQLFDLFVDHVELSFEKNGVRGYLLLLFDEYEILDYKVRQGQLSDEVSGFFRSLMQKRTRIFFIFTGTRQLELLESAHWSLMFNQAVYRKISFLDELDARNLMEVPLRGLARFNADAIASILRLTCGHPFFIQLICLNIVEILNRKKIRDVTAEEVDMAVTSLNSHPIPHLIYLWKERSQEERLVVAALSEAIPDSSSWASIGDLEEKLAGETFSLTAAQIKAALSGCVQEEMLEQSPEKCYRFRMDLLRQWIAAEHPLWKVADSEALI